MGVALLLPFPPTKKATTWPIPSGAVLGATSPPRPRLRLPGPKLPPFQNRIETTKSGQGRPRQNSPNRHLNRLENSRGASLRRFESDTPRSFSG